MLNKHIKSAQYSPGKHKTSMRGSTHPPEWVKLTDNTKYWQEYVTNTLINCCWED